MSALLLLGASLWLPQHDAQAQLVVLLPVILLLLLTFTPRSSDPRTHSARHVHGTRDYSEIRMIAQRNDVRALLQTALPAAVVAGLRTDQAGEAGAVRIYEGVLAVTRDPALRAFALRHLATEKSHLQLIEAWLPRTNYSRLLPIWRAAGWMTGALPALLGPRAVYCTIEAVETFVDLHYAQQIEHLASYTELASLRQTLMDCQGDELAHRIEAATARGAAPGALLLAWSWLVGAGSRGAVAICRHI